MVGQTCRRTVLLAPMDQSPGASKPWMDDKYTLWLLQQPAPLTHPLLTRATVPEWLKHETLDLVLWVHLITAYAFVGWMICAYMGRSL